MRAAEALHLTASAVSQQLALLEREVGLALIDRSQRRAALTPAGRVLAGYAERIDEELAEARRELIGFTERLAGPVSIAAFPTVIRHLLVPVLGKMAERHPQITPRIRELYGSPALRELRLGTVDLALTEQDADMAAPARQSIISHPLYVDEYRIVVPPSWTEVPRDVADLADAPGWPARPTRRAGGRWNGSPPCTASPPAGCTSSRSSRPRSPWSRRGTGWRSCRRWPCSTCRTARSW